MLNECQCVNLLQSQQSGSLSRDPGCWQIFVALPRRSRTHITDWEIHQTFTNITKCCKYCDQNAVINPAQAGRYKKRRAVHLCEALLVTEALVSSLTAHLPIEPIAATTNYNSCQTSRLSYKLYHNDSRIVVKLFSEYLLSRDCY